MGVKILQGDCLEVLPTLGAESVHCCITSPPYWGLRDYNVAGMIGLEDSFQDWLAVMVEVFREVRRVLRKDGTLFINCGDAYAGSPNGRSAADTKELGIDNRTFRDRPVNTATSGFKPKDLLMMPARLAIALQEDGWFLRAQMPWVKRNPMPDSATDRPGVSVEYVFMFAKSKRYFWDGEGVRQPSITGDTRKPYAPGQVDKRGNGHDRGGGQNTDRDGSGRNFRASDLFYSSLTEPYGLITDSDGNPLALDVNPQGLGLAHFAAFPPKLIEPLIKAGTSEKGVCAGCGAPWMREVEAKVSTSERHEIGHGAHCPPSHHAGQTPHRKGGFYPETKTTGWRPSCTCERDMWNEDKSSHPPVPATILDPFLGAGTTALVADRLGRDCIGIELNPEYVEMARNRVRQDAGMFADVT